MSHIVKCRICSKPMDLDNMDKAQWIMPSRNWYYHIKCYQDWKVSESHDDGDWQLLIFDFIARDLKVSYDFMMCSAQIEKYQKEYGYTKKGIYFALKYFYEIKHGDWNKGHGGIGIIPYIYNESTAYWIDQEQKKNGILSEIEAQIRSRINIPVTHMQIKKKGNKSKWRLGEVDG